MFRRPPKDPYKVLRISKDAQTLEIRRAYRQLALECHPDKVTDSALKAEKAKQYQEVQEAYTLLSDSIERREYERNKIEILPQRDRRTEMTPQGFNLGGSHWELLEQRHNTSLHNQPKSDRMTQWSTQVGPPPRFAKYTTYVPRRSDGEDRREQNEMPEKSRSRKKSNRGILVVHGRFEGQKIIAIPDTGAECNIIAGFLVDKLQLRNRIKQPSTRQPLRMANGQYTITSGVLEASWRFGGEISRPWKVIFHILEDFVHDLILGNKFLMETQTMSYNKHRLDHISRPVNALSVLRVNLLGEPSQRLHGFVDDAEILAFPDSGSEPNLVSLDFIQAQGWQYKINSQDRRLLQFADGSTTESEGSIRGRWKCVQEGNRKQTSVMADFHVLRDCVYDVIVGQDVLMETDAFLQYKDDFVYLESKHSSAAMNLVWFASRKAKKAPPPPNPDTLAMVELERRALADQSIRRLPLGPERDKARRKEEANRQLFDQQQESARLTSPPSANLPNLTRRPGIIIGEAVQGGRVRV